MFVPVQSVNILGTDPPNHVMDHNISVNMAADYPRLHLRPDWGKSKGRALAIVGGGPSLDASLPMIYEKFPDVMVCGSAHDHVIGHGIDPTYSIQCDGSRMALDFIKTRVSGTQYLLASCCHPEMFKGLSEVWIWHCLGSGSHPTDEPAIAGGCTIMLRALTVSILLGYRDLHFFGMDSCFSEAEAQHAYAYPEDEINRNTITVRVNGGREFLTNSVFTAQAQHFQEMCKNFGHLFEPHVYGDGLIAEMIKVGLKKGTMNE